MSHGDQVDTLADGFVKDAYSDTCTFAATSQYREEYLYSAVPSGSTVIPVWKRDTENFVLRSAGRRMIGLCTASLIWKLRRFARLSVQTKALLDLSGAWIPLLLRHFSCIRRSGDQLICMFIDLASCERGKRYGDIQARDEYQSSEN